MSHSPSAQQPGSIGGLAEQLGRVLAGSCFEIYVFDAHSLRFLEVSDGARRNLGYTAEELRRLTPLDIKPRFDAASFAETLAPIWDGREEVVSFETVHRRKDGSEYPVEVRVELFAAEDPPVFLAVLQDITERRRVEQALHESRARLQEQADRLAAADAQKDEFLAMLGHELRNFLAPVCSSLELLSRGSAGLEPELQHCVAALERQYGHIARLVDDLLDLGRIRRGELQIERRPVALHDCLQAAVDTVRPLAEQQRQHIALASPPDPGLVLGDAHRLTQVFTNLLQNAVRYGGRGGRIDIAVEREADALRVCVRDQGAGIPAELLPRVFEPGDAGLRRLPGPHGLGIGLSIVSRLVALHGGTVSAASEGEGLGSEFCVRLPSLPAKA